MSQQDVLTVGQLNNQIRDTLQGQFRSIWVGGEITDLSRPRSGHIYFSLKDASGQVNGIMWRSTVERLAFDPEDGMEVLCCGDVDVYPPRGTYQLIVRRMQLQGEGALQTALRQLRERLEAEGLFDPARKRPIPQFARHIAVVTSLSGAALRDFLEVVRRRWADVRISLVPTRVQGTDVGPEIASAIGDAARLVPDVIVVTRGGGSLEDLWAFNEEVVVRAIHASPIPVISAIGHEIDVTLADLVADRRALTPSEAGELVVPDAAELRQRLGSAEARLHNLLRGKQQHAQARLQALMERRVWREPMSLLRDRQRMVDELAQRSTRAAWSRTDAQGQQLAQHAAQLQSLSPLNVLARGYAIAQDASDRVVRSHNQVKPGDTVRVRLPDGQFSAIVDNVSQLAESTRRQQDQS